MGLVLVLMGGSVGAGDGLLPGMMRAGGEGFWMKGEEGSGEACRLVGRDKSS